MLKTSNLTLERKQLCIPREGNPGSVLLTSRIRLKYFYQCSLVINLHTSMPSFFKSTAVQRSSFDFSNNLVYNVAITKRQPKESKLHNDLKNDCTLIDKFNMSDV